MTEIEVQDQLKQIAEQQLVYSGDLINKQAKAELLRRKWIMYYEDEDFKIPGHAKGTGGYCITELGKTQLETTKPKP